ncbi:hypothetical protein NECID01_0446 [Nematocida sp. AWRm77]|nr:hypothetical protein NECID01_0446 [Nematocida sp. AWRm77]
MLYQSIRSVSKGSVETKEGARYTGLLSLDKKLNASVGDTFIKSSDIRYIILDDAETEKVLLLERSGKA